jgi:cytochrome P450
MAQELVCKGNNFVLRPFNQEFMHHQQMQAPVLSPRAASCYVPLQDFESRLLLKNMLTTNDFVFQYERFAASIVYTLIFGLRFETGHEWQIDVSHKNLAKLDNAAEIGVWIVDTLPILNLLPTALAPWKRTAKKWYQDCSSMAMENFQNALSRPGWNWSKDFANSKEGKQMSATEISWDLNVFCDAGVATTNDMLQVCTLACLAFPEWMTAAQQELDTVVGEDRLPTFQDLHDGKLPYIHAVIEEMFRWGHILPTGIAHATTKDDEYNGYLIPKGSIVIPLFRAMRNDPQHFDSPAHFRPERWLTGKSQSQSNFGYGRRVCPGRFIAKNSLLIAVARLLWGFNITGEKFVVDEDMFTSGIVSSPKPFEACFEVRSEKHRHVIEEAWETMEKDQGNLMNEIRERQIEVGLNPRA